MSTQYGQQPPPPAGELRRWAEQLNDYLGQTRSQLVTADTAAPAGEDGRILWDRTGYPVVAHDGRYRQIVLADGYAQLVRTSDATAAAINTPYAVVFDDPPGLIDEYMSLGTPASRVEFSEPGIYLLCFTAQMESSSASTITFYFWPRINGVDISGSTMHETLHVNGATKVASRSALFPIAAGDYLEAMWATDSTSGSLKAHAATAFCPAAPAVTLSVTRIRQ